MSRVNDLIKDLTPKGVPIQPLGQVGVFIRGRRFTKADRVDDGLPSIHYGEIYTHYGVAASETHSRVRADLAPTLRFAQPGDVIIAGVGETVEDVGKAVAWLGTEPVAVHDDCFIFRSSLDPKFVVYFMQSEAFNKPKEAYVARAKVKRLSSDGLARLRIPVPPIEVQREIVRVLDTFSGLASDLATQLDAELEARQRQSAYYHDQVLSFRDTDGVQWIPLGGLLREPLANGRSVPDGSGYPVLRLTALHGSVVDTSRYKLGAWDPDVGRRFRIEAGDLLVARGNGSKDLIARASMVERTDEVAFPDTMIRVRPKLEIVSQRYLFYIWESQATRSIIERIAKATSGVWKVSQDDLSRVMLPVPSIEEQHRIVGILDKIDALMGGLSAALPAERNARRRQYEYYRDRLLTFKESMA